jgi:hypothetical protein
MSLNFATKQARKARQRLYFLPVFKARTNIFSDNVGKLYIYQVHNIYGFNW